MARSHDRVAPQHTPRIQPFPRAVNLEEGRAASTTSKHGLWSIPKELPDSRYNCRRSTPSRKAVSTRAGENSVKPKISPTSLANS
eukprot:3557540-Pyramimonas_sp.AAC.1